MSVKVDNVQGGDDAGVWQNEVKLGMVLAGFEHVIARDLEPQALEVVSNEEGVDVIFNALRLSYDLVGMNLTFAHSGRDVRSKFSLINSILRIDTRMEHTQGKLCNRWEAIEACLGCDAALGKQGSDLQEGVQLRKGEMIANIP